MARDKSRPKYDRYSVEKGHININLGLPKEGSGNIPKKNSDDIFDRKEKLKAKPAGSGSYFSDLYKQRPNYDDEPKPIDRKWVYGLVIPAIAAVAGLSRAYAEKHGASFLGSINDLETLRLVSYGIPILGGVIGFFNEAGYKEGFSLESSNREELIGAGAGGLVALVCERSAYFIGHSIF